MKAGFARREISPPPGTRKIGWLREVVGERILDPLYARAFAVEDATGERAAVVVLDVLSVPWRLTSAVRAAVRGVAPERVMVCATHTHAGPAVARAGVVPRDDGYAARAAAVAGAAVDEAVAAFVPAVLTAGEAAESSVTFNRRVVMRDGTVKTHGSLKDPDAVRLEGPIDPEVRALAFRTPGGEPVGLVVHHPLHPTHHGDDEVFSAGWPGALCDALEANGWPRAVFLQGTLGDVHHQDPAGASKHPPERIGEILAGAVERALPDARPGPDLVGTASADLRLPYRTPTDAEVRGTVKGAQRFIDPAIYDAGMPRLLQKIRANGEAKATLQALRLGDTILVSLPGEVFVEYGLALKRSAAPGRSIIPVGCANGMLGYIPTRAAFDRGGYETTFAASSKLAPEAGDLLTAAARDLAARI